MLYSFCCQEISYFQNKGSLRWVRAKVSASFEFHAYLDLSNIVGWSLLLVQSIHFGMTQGNLSGKWNFNGMGFWHVLLFQLTFCLVVLTCESEESITRSTLIQQQQCKITTSLKVFDSQASLTLAFCFTIKPNCRMACYVMNSFGEIIVYMPTLFFKICCC